MKAITRINRIIENQKCSISECEKLSESLRREGRIREKETIRFCFLFGTFQIVNRDFMESEEITPYSEPVSIETLKTMLF